MDEEVKVSNNNETGVVEASDIKGIKKITKPTIYTEEFVKNEVSNLWDEAQNEDIIVLGQLFEKKAYSRQRFSEWEKTFKNIKEISDTIKKIRELFENKVNVGALKGKLNATMAIFNLKNNYGWKDKSEQEMTVNLPKPLLDNVHRNESTKENTETD